MSSDDDTRHRDLATLLTQMADLAGQAQQVTADLTRDEPNDPDYLYHLLRIRSFIGWTQNHITAIRQDSDTRRTA